MFRLRKSLPIVALLVGGAIFGAPAPARATFQLQVYDDGVLTAVTGTVIVVGGVTTLSYGPSATTDFVVSGTATLQLDAQNASLHVSYNTSVLSTSSGTHTLTLLVSNTGYMAPTGNPILLTSSGGGSYTGISPNSISGVTQGVLDATSPNVLYGNGAGTAITVNAMGAPTNLVAGQSTPQSTTGTVVGNGGAENLVYTPGTGAKVVPSAVPFTLTNISFFTFNGQGAANISNSLDTQTVPAPAGLVLVLTGAPLLGIGAWLQRRRQSRLIAA